MTRAPLMTTFPIAICQMAASSETVGQRAHNSETVGAPWWLAERYERHLCADCEKRLGDEDLFYCQVCGRDLCPECVEILPETREVQCSQCAAANK